MISDQRMTLLVAWFRRRAQEWDQVRMLEESGHKAKAAEAFGRLRATLAKGLAGMTWQEHAAAVNAMEGRC